MRYFNIVVLVPENKRNVLRWCVQTCFIDSVLGGTSRDYLHILLYKSCAQVRVRPLPISHYYPVYSYTLISKVTDMERYVLVSEILSITLGFIVSWYAYIVRHENQSRPSYHRDTSQHAWYIDSSVRTVG
jgi:hypothetical protein